MEKGQILSRTTEILTIFLLVSKFVNSTIEIAIPTSGAVGTNPFKMAFTPRVYVLN